MISALTSSLVTQCGRLPHERLLLMPQREKLRAPPSLRQPSQLQMAMTRARTALLQIVSGTEYPSLANMPRDIDFHPHLLYV